MSRPYSDIEKRLIREGLRDSRTAEQIGKILGRPAKNIRAKARSMGLKMPRGGARPHPAPNTSTRKRPCLKCGNTFDAELNDEGRLVERICKKCKTTNEWRAGA